MAQPAEELESFNRGSSWAPRTDYMPTLATGALAFNPTSRISFIAEREKGIFMGDWEQAFYVHSMEEQPGHFTAALFH